MICSGLSVLRLPIIDQILRQSAFPLQLHCAPLCMLLHKSCSHKWIRSHRLTRSNGLSCSGHIYIFLKSSFDHVSTYQWRLGFLLVTVTEILPTSIKDQRIITPAQKKNRLVSFPHVVVLLKATDNLKLFNFDSWFSITIPLL